MDNWRSAKDTLAQSLGHIFEVGLYSDVTFEVGKKKFKLNAHRSVLSARSEPLAVMLHERWNPVKEEGQIIQIPDFNFEPFKMFLKFLYTDSIELNKITLEEVLQLIHIAHMYQVQRLFDQCKLFFSSKIDESTCLHIYKSTKTSDKGLSEMAFNYFLRNILQTATNNKSYLNYDPQLIEDILESNKFLVPEITLFNALLNWKNVNRTERENHFRKLVHLIRFPTMNIETIGKEVDIHNIFSSLEMLELYKYVATKGVYGNIAFNTRPRQFPQENHVKLKMYQNVSRYSRSQTLPEANELEFTLETSNPVKMVAVELLEIDASMYKQLKIEISVVAKPVRAKTVDFGFIAEDEVLGKVVKDYKASQQVSNSPLKVWFDKPIELIPGKQYLIEHYTIAHIQKYVPGQKRPQQLHLRYWRNSSMKENISFGTNTVWEETKLTTLEVRKTRRNISRQDFIFIESLIFADLVSNKTHDCNIQCPVM